MKKKLVGFEPRSFTLMSRSALIESSAIIFPDVCYKTYAASFPPSKHLYFEIFCEPLYWSYRLNSLYLRQTNLHQWGGLDLSLYTQLLLASMSRPILAVLGIPKLSSSQVLSHFLTSSLKWQLAYPTLHGRWRLFETHI